MRLGDLDALKEDLKQYFSDGTLDSVSAKLAFNMILRKIDEAPTVELFCSYLSDGEVKEPCVEAPCKHERTPGDLISRSEAEKLGATCLARRNENGQLEAIISLDNAPTVEITEEQAIDKLHETGWLIRHDKEMTERPHIIDNCDMNVFEPEKYMEGGAEE